MLAYCFANADSPEWMLLRDLLSTTGYSTYERPVVNHRDPVVVKLGFELEQIVDLEWVDQNLKWQPSEYGNIKDIRLPITKVWKPDVLLYNSVDSGFEKTFAVNVKLMYDGTVTWSPPAVMKTSCKIDVTYFPFDDQLCHFKFGSWTYNGAKLDLQIGEKGLDIGRYKKNGEWHLLEHSVNRTTKFYSCCREPYYDVRFYLRLRRRTLFYGFNLIIPSLLVSIMALLAFTLPPDAGEKIALELTVLLSLCYCLQMIADMTPPTSEAVPLLSKFFICCILLISCSSVCCVLVLNMHHADPDTQLPMHPILALILLKWLPALILMRRPARRTGRSRIKRHRTPNTKRSSKFIDQNASKPHFDESNCDEQVRQQNGPAGRNAIILTKMTELIKDKAKTLAKMFRKNEEDSAFKNDWKYAAMVVDRLCLITFTTMTVSFTCSIFFSASYVSA